MILEQQVDSLELAKKLKDLGVERDSLGVWTYFNDDEHPAEYWIAMTQSDRERAFPHHRWISAFTVAELGDMLPRDVRSEKAFTSRQWICTSLRTPCFFWSPTEADARAKMLIYLIEDGLIGGWEDSSQRNPSLTPSTN